MVTDALGLAAALAAGMGVGLVFFAGLWATVRALPNARRPGTMMLGSFVARTGMAVVAFGLLARAGGWAWVAAGLIGLTAARVMLVRRLGPSAALRSKEAR